MMPAARITDMHVCPMVTPGVPPIPHVGGPILTPGGPTVLIGNLPAATVGSMCTCVGPPDSIVKGSMTVLICGKPAARIGDLTAHGGSIVAGVSNRINWRLNRTEWCDFMPKQVIASEGDTLCGIAIGAGFLNCDPIRSEAANAGKGFLNRALKRGDVITVPDIRKKTVEGGTENKHRFRQKNAPPVEIQFVHGSPDLPYRDDVALALLNVSNYRSNRGGRTGTSSFPTGHEFSWNGHHDEDTFKVQVVDPAAGGSVKVALEALKPKYKANGDLDSHEPYTGAQAANHKRDVDCHLVKNSVCHRTAYHRLVIDPEDFNAIPNQALLLSGAEDGANGANDRVEILDHQVRASYEYSRCPASLKCKVSVTLPVGENTQRAKVSVHILRNAAKVPVVTQVTARMRVLKFVRQLYAQANLSVKIVGMREVELPANMFTIADGRGRTAQGTKTITVRIRIDATTDVQAAITTTALDRPIATANALATAIKAVVPAGTKVVASENSPLIGQTIGSADVIVGDPLTQTVQLNVMTSDDARHPVRVAQLASTTVTEFGGNDSHVGTSDERVLVKNYDTGAGQIDLFIVQALHLRSLGEAFTANFGRAVARQPKPEMTNSVIVDIRTFASNNNYHTTVPHEIGHVLMDCSHASVATEMMGAGSPVGANERIVNGPKRITANRSIGYDNGVRDIPVKLIRTTNVGLLDSW